MLPVEALADLENATVRNEVFSDEEVYRLELERVFGRCWLFLGHESMIPKRGDYFTNFMGEDAVIVTRDGQDRVRVFLNKCRHRANKVCLFDRGSAASFVCSYHGWSYGSDGALNGVPFLDEAYYGDLDRASMGLLEVPKVAIYGGLIFACWDAGAISLDEYLGEARWYLDNFLLAEFVGGLEIVPGTHKYMMPVNWKLVSENFAGDSYHFRVTHASVVKVLARGQTQGAQKLDSAPGNASTGAEFSVALNYQRGAPHGIFEVNTSTGPLERDLAQAAALGPEVREWVAEKQRRVKERVAHIPNPPYSFHVGNLFPNFSIIGPGSQLYGRGLILQHPRGPHATEVWQWCAVEKEAPRALKERMVYVLMHRQAATGLVAPDDHENFERMTENLATPMSRRTRLNYQMGLGHEDRFPSVADWTSRGLPGFPAPQYSEVNQRELYRFWVELMREPGASNGHVSPAAAATNGATAFAQEGGAP